MAMASIYYITGEAGDPGQARDGFRGLVKDCEGALETEHPFLANPAASV